MVIVRGKMVSECYVNPVFKACPYYFFEVIKVFLLHILACFWAMKVVVSIGKRWEEIFFSVAQLVVRRG